jgi:putative membrane-bound dehydrogenase-like protein
MTVAMRATMRIRKPRPGLPAIFLAVGSLLAWGVRPGHSGDRPPNDQAAADQPAAARDAVRRMTVPEGFRVEVAASEPDVRQPIAIAQDGRGRLWVAESLSYNGSDFTDRPADRILIFEDSDGDGVLERRSVFAEGLNRLTGLEVGFGGVWITAPPHLSFLPDRDRDDHPDGPPVVLLDGWSLQAEHNSVNGLTWGPDGWLYGRHGIKAPSAVGKPGTPAAGRVALSCAIWRYHPTRHEFELVADGTVNPWGLDFDAYGEGFFTTSVVDHLWHLIPGAHYERRKGQDTHPDPHAYALLGPINDHRHWGSDTWNRGGEDGGNADTPALGGGHSHSGALIYQGDNWPGRYRGAILMSNIHGHRINLDRLERQGASYRARHDGDFLRANDDWFRAVALATGPDGGVFVTDWSDLGECHDRDGVHRTSGRIYKVVHGRPQPVRVDLDSETHAQLADRHRHENEWFVRLARRILHERAAAGADLSAAHALLLRQYEEDGDVPLKLRALWTLWLTRGVDRSWLLRQLDHRDEPVRAWSIRLLAGERPVPAETLRAFAERATADESPLVRLTLASVMTRVPPRDRWPTLERLARWDCDADDPSIPPMIWHGLEPLVQDDPGRALDLARASRIPRIRRFVARRLGSELGNPRVATTCLFESIRDETDGAIREDLLRGTVESLRGRREVAVAPDEAAVLRRVAAEGDSRPARLATLALLALGDAEARHTARALIVDRRVDAADRMAALRDLAAQRPPDLPPLLFRLLDDDRLAVTALESLQAYDHPDTARILLRRLPAMHPGERRIALSTLAARVASASALLDAVERGAIEARAISAEQARQIVNLRDEPLAARLERLWGRARPTPAEQRKEINRVKKLLSGGILGPADLASGGRLFADRCAACHQLHGNGGSIGPDLTGSDRLNLDYLLTNVIDPSAAVAADFRLSIVLTADDRVLSGIVDGGGGNTLTVRTATGPVTLDRRDVAEIKASPSSLMPDGLLQSLSDLQIRDLFGYLGAPP